MKKKFSFALLLGCLVILKSNLFAQETNEAKTLFGNENPISAKSLGYFLAPSYALTHLDGGEASMLNLRGGVSLRDQISLGAYFNTSFNQVIPQSETLANVYMDYWSVGGFAELTLFPKKMVHLTFPLYVGYGEVEMDNETDDLDLGEANFIQIEPSALVEVNLHKHVRFDVGVGYRFVSQMNYRNFDQSDISGFTGHAGLKFGLFR